MRSIGFVWEYGSDGKAADRDGSSCIASDMFDLCDADGGAMEVAVVYGEDVEDDGGERMVGGLGRV